jgi:hypothetical protein
MSAPIHQLGYGRAPKRVQEAAGRTFFHQAAKASWVAPLVALLLGFCTLDYRRQPDNRDSAMIIGVVNVLLIAGGFALAIVAFFGIKRHGSDGIVLPAIVGLIINGLLVFAMLTLLQSASRARIAANGGGRTAPGPVPITSPQSVFRQTGWVGSGAAGGVNIILLAMPDDHADTIAVKNTFNTRAGIMVMTIDNRQNRQNVSVTTEGATLHFADGSTAATLKTADVVQTVPSATSSKYMPPYNVPAGQMVEGRLLFIRPNLKLDNLQKVDLNVDGQAFQVPGRIVTAQEKTDRLNAPGPDQ